MTTTIEETDSNYWSGSCDPCDPDNYWIDDDTNERVDCVTNERTPHKCSMLDASGQVRED